MIDYKKIVSQTASEAGIKVNGTRAWDLQVHSETLYRKLVLYGTLGLGEGYMDGDWDCENIDQLIAKLLRARIRHKAHFSLATGLAVIAHLFSNLQSLARSKQVAERHYDLNNQFYARMLDSRMIYSCGYWKGKDNLDAAQAAKLDLVCQKLELKEGETLLDIGCGWGGMAKYAAQHYGVKVTGVTISKEQAAHATKICEDFEVDILLKDYRHIQGKYDKIVSIGMFEHVGTKNYVTYMKTIRDLLRDDGLFLLHTIGHRYRTLTNDSWSNKYIFPNGKIPYIDQIGKSLSGRLVLEDWHNFGMDYATTLRAWHRNFETHWPQFKDSYGERFYRMWRYYLLSYAGAFQARHMQLWQLVLTKPERRRAYFSIRP